MAIEHSNIGEPPVSYDVALSKFMQRQMEEAQLLRQTMGRPADPFAAVTGAKPAAAKTTATIQPVPTVTPAADLPSADHLLRQTTGQAHDPFAGVSKSTVATPVAPAAAATVEAAPTAAKPTAEAQAAKPTEPVAPPEGTLWRGVTIIKNWFSPIFKAAGENPAILQ